VYVVAFGGGQGKWQVSANGAARRPQWSKDGKELYYLDPTFNLFAVPVKDIGGALQFGAPQTLVSNWSAPEVYFDVSPDARKSCSTGFRSRWANLSPWLQISRRG
jgi:hypothetical protein